MGRLLKYLLILVVVVFLRAFLKTLFSGTRSVEKRPSGVPEGGELKKDPVCGTYVSASASITDKFNGQLVHFCSEECRKKYHAA